MNNLFFPLLTTNLNLPNVKHKRKSNPSSISIIFYFCLVPLTQTRIHMTRKTKRREDIRSKSRQWCPEPEQLRSVSDFELLSGSDEDESTALDAFAFSYVRGRDRGHAVVWDGRVKGVSSSDDDMPYNWASGRGRSRGRAAPSVTATANLPGRARDRGRARTAGSSQPGVRPSS